MLNSSRSASRALLVLSIILTAAIVYWQLLLRSEIYDPYSLVIFQLLFLFPDYQAAWLLLGITLLGLLPPVQTAGVRLAQWMGSHPMAAASLTTVALALAAKFIYHAHPLCMDEYAPLFQSKIFAAGQVKGKLPVDLLEWLVPEGFQNYFIMVSHDTGEVASAYWPGFALMLTPFTWLGVPWLANPVIGGATVLVAYKLASVLFKTEAAAGMAMLLTLSSVAVTVNAISFYSMSAHLLLNGVFALLLLSPSPRRAFAAGLVGSLSLVLHNPLPHALFACCWFAWILFCQPQRWRLMAALVAGYLPLSLLLGIGWSLLLDDFRHLAAVNQPAVDFTHRWAGIIGGILRLPSPEMLAARLIGLCKLWLWASPGLLLLAVSGARAWRMDRRLLVFAGCAAVTIFAYLFVPYDQGHGWGFRYFHSAWIALPLLATGAMMAVAEGRTFFEMPLTRYAAGAALLSLVLMTALRFYQVEDFMDRHLAQVPRAKTGTASITIINPALGYYAGDLVQNDPFMRGPAIFISRGMKADAALLAEKYPQYSRLSVGYRGTVWGVPPNSER